jgi:hypothetical protein
LSDSTGICGYNENRLAKELSELPPGVRASFACACAERLMPTYQWFCLTTGSGSYDLLREALNDAWTANATGQASELRIIRKKVVDAPHPEESPRMFPGAAVAQNAVAAARYAMDVSLTGDVQASVWVARQLYEAADTVVQQSAATQTYITNIECEQLVRMTLEGIAAAFDDARRLSVAELRARAGKDGEEFLAILTGQV